MCAVHSLEERLRTWLGACWHKPEHININIYIISTAKTLPFLVKSPTTQACNCSEVYIHFKLLKEEKKKRVEEKKLNYWEVIKSQLVGIFVPMSWSTRHMNATRSDRNDRALPVSDVQTSEYNFFWPISEASEANADRLCRMIYTFITFNIRITMDGMEYS